MTVTINIDTTFKNVAAIEDLQGLIATHGGNRPLCRCVPGHGTSLGRDRRGHSQHHKYWSQLNMDRDY